MKKTALITTYFLMLSAFVLFSTHDTVAQECPFGLADDPAPGQCGLYADEQRDGYCDLSHEAEKPDEVQASGTIKLKQYPFFAVLLPLLAFYFFTWYSVKSALITRMAHRVIWNALLLVFFLISGSLGAVLILRINYGIFADPPFNLLYWHVEAGLAMAIVSVFHVIWHLNYYYCAFRNLFKKKPEKCL